MQILSHKTWQLHQNVDLTMKQRRRQFCGQNKVNYGILKHIFTKFGGNILTNLEFTVRIG